MTDRSDDAQTKPTMNTVLERINALGNDLREQIGGLRSDLASMVSDQASLRADLASMVSDQTSVRNDLTSLRDEFHLFRGDLEIRLDRIEGMTNQTRAEMLNLRADFREWRGQLKDIVA